MDWKVAVITPVLVFSASSISRRRTSGRCTVIDTVVWKCWLPAGIGDDVVAEADLGELEGAPVDIGSSGSVTTTRWAGAVAVGAFSKSIAVGQRGIAGDEAFRPVAGRPGLVVRVP